MDMHSTCRMPESMKGLRGSSSIVDTSIGRANNGSISKIEKIMDRSHDPFCYNIQPPDCQTARRFAEPISLTL